MHPFILSLLDYGLLASLSSCLDFLPVMDCNLEFLTKINPLFCQDMLSHQQTESKTRVNFIGIKEELRVDMDKDMGQKLSISVCSCSTQKHSLDYGMVKHKIMYIFNTHTQLDKFVNKCTPVKSALQSMSYTLLGASKGGEHT